MVLSFSGKGRREILLTGRKFDLQTVGSAYRGVRPPRRKNIMFRIQSVARASRIRKKGQPNLPRVKTSLHAETAIKQMRYDNEGTILLCFLFPNIRFPHYDIVFHGPTLRNDRADMP